MESAFSPRARCITAWLVGACVTRLTSSAIAGDLTFTPRIVGQELFTDNVLLTPTNRRSDFVTTLSPVLSISDDSPRLQAKLDYSPTLSLYALTPGQNFIGQNLYANGTATVVPELFFLDARGLLSVQPSVPGLGTGLLPTTVPSLLGPTFFNTSQGIPQSQLAQVSSFSACNLPKYRASAFHPTLRGGLMASGRQSCAIPSATQISAAYREQRF